MIFLYHGFIVLLWFINLFGFLFGSVLIVKSVIRFKWLGVIAGVLWLLFYVFFFLAFAYKGLTTSGIHFMNVHISTIAIISSSILVAYAAKQGEDYIEENKNPKRLVVLFLRTFVIAIGAVCIAITGASIKSYAYHEGYTKYSYGKELSMVLKEDSLSQIEPFARDFTKLMSF